MAQRDSKGRFVASGLVVPIEGDSSNLEKEFSKTSTMAGAWAVGLGNIISQGFLALISTAADLATGAIREVIDVLADSVDVSKDFQSSVADLSIAASKTDYTLQELHDIALTVGGDTSLLGVSASGAAESMTNLYKAGLETTDIFGDLNGYLAGTIDLGGALRASIDLAAASELDMVQASELAATTLATFGWQAEEAGQSVDEWIVGALDNLVKSADASVADVSDLAAAMTSVGPTASAFGFTLEDVNNALALLSTRGIKGAEAGTALKSMLTNIMRPTNQVQDALQALNIDLYNTDGTMRSLPEILGNFEQAMMGVNEVTTIVGGRTREQQDELERLQSVYSRTRKSISDYELGIKGATLSDDARAKKLAELRLVLLNTGAAVNSLDAIQGTAITTTKALTEEQRNAHIQTLAGTYGMKAMQTLLSEGVEGWDAMAMATDDAMGTQAQAAVKANTLSGALEGLDGIIEALKIGIGDAFLPVLQDLAVWATQMAEDYGPLVVDIFSQIGEAVSIVFALFGETDFGAIFEDLTNLDFSSFGEFLSQLGIELDLPWLDVLASFFTETLPSAIETVSGPLSVFYGWLSELIPLAMQVVSDYWEKYLKPVYAALFEAINTTVVPALMELWKWFQERIPQAIKVVSDFWTNYLAPALQELGVIVSTYVIPMLAEIAVWFIETIPIALDNFIAFWSGYVWPVILAAMTWFQENAWPIIVQVIAWLSENIPVALEILRAIFVDVVWPAMYAVMDWFIVNALPVIQQVITWLQTNIPIALEFLRALWVDTIWPAIQTALEWFDTNATPIIDTIIEWLEKTLPEALEVLRAMWEDKVWPAIQAVIEAVWAIIEPIWTEVQRWLEDNMPTILEALQTVFETVWLAIQTAIEDMWEIVDPIWAKIKKWVETTIPPLLTALSEAWGLAWDIVKTKVETMWEKVGTIFDAIRAFAEWIKTAVFGFNIKIPDIPDWMVPKSPLPIHTAWRDFAEWSATTQITPQISAESIDTSMLGVLSGVEETTSMNVREGDQFNLTAQYQHEDERTLIDRVKFLQLEQAIATG